MDLDGLHGTNKEALALENANEKRKNTKIKSEMRQTHFNYGKDQTLYASTNNS